MWNSKLSVETIFTGLNLLPLKDMPDEEDIPNSGIVLLGSAGLARNIALTRWLGLITLPKAARVVDCTK